MTADWREPASSKDPFTLCTNTSVSVVIELAENIDAVHTFTNARIRAQCERPVIQPHDLDATSRSVHVRKNIL